MLTLDAGQHIRRERATSNICPIATDALAAAVYMSTMAVPAQRGRLNYHKAHYAADQLTHCVDSVVDRLSRSLTVRRQVSQERCGGQRALLDEHGILGGYDLGGIMLLKNHMLVAVTEMNTKEQIDEWWRCSSIYHKPPKPVKKAARNRQKESYQAAEKAAVR
jgi:glycine dehydrogenase subunit 1